MASRRKLIQWFKDHQGMVSYSRDHRTGPDSFDGAGAMFSALIYADYLSKHCYVGTMAVLCQLEGSLLQPIQALEARRGDIFISKVQEGEGEGEGHTGVVYDRRRIIYCCREHDGIAVSRLMTWPGEVLSWYRLAEPVIREKSILERVEQGLAAYNRRRALQAVRQMDVEQILNLARKVTN